MEDWQNIFCHLCGADNPSFEVSSTEILEVFNIKLFNDEILACGECDNLMNNVRSFKSRALIMNSFLEELSTYENIEFETFDEIRNRFGILNNSSEHLIEHVDALDEAFEHEEFIEEETTNFEEIKEKTETGEDLTETLFELKCHICNEEFGSMRILSNHCQKSHQTSAQVACFCGELLDSVKSLNAHKSKHLTEKNFRCNFCNLTYKTQAALDRHDKQKHGPDAERFICKECGKEFKDKQVLKNHERIHLPEEKKMKTLCNECGKKFVNNHCLKIHIMRVHEKMAVFTCETCGKTFVTKSDLNWHRDKHIKERNFECEICKCKFKSKNSLRIHKRRHFSTDKKYICRECGKEFNSSAALSNHRLVHSEVKRYKCFCGNEYKRLESFKCHQSVHSGVRPYSCNWCTRTFVNSANCRKHKLKEHPTEVKEFESVHGKRGVSLAVKVEMK